ncbi:nitroreductase family protein [Halovulum sp. GXIMD14793]
MYRAIRTRRDVRGQFLPDPVAPELLQRLLMAAHHAPSVGFMQPWNFIVIRNLTVKTRVKAAFQKANAAAATMFSGNRRELYFELKLAGITEAPVNLCIGHVQKLYTEPELQARGWAKRLPLDELIFQDRWDGTGER